MSTSDAKCDTEDFDLTEAARRLADEAHSYNFYQAVSLLAQLQKRNQDQSCGEEPLRFVSTPTLSFPASAIQRVDLAEGTQPAEVAVNFMGLTGPSGVLPRHYTEKVMQVERDCSGENRSTIRAWFDMFTSRFIWSMYRAWQKMRIDRSLPVEDGPQPPEGAFARSLFSLIGFGQNALRNRLQVKTLDAGGPDEAHSPDDRVRDWALLRHTSVLARRRRSASQIARVLSDYFQVPVEVQQFQGQWLELERESQTRLGDPNASSQLGNSAIVGRRVWDVESKLSLRVGPLNREQFENLLPCVAPKSERRRFFMLCQLARVLIGPEFDFDVQLVIDRQAVPSVQLNDGTAQDRFRLGWNTWLAPTALRHDPADAVFNSVESTVLGAAEHQSVA